MGEGRGGKKLKAGLGMAVKIILSVLFSGFVLFLLYLYEVLLPKPKRLRSKLEDQGIKGPCPVFMLGNITEMKRIKVKVMESTGTETTNTTTTSMNHHHFSTAHHWPSTIFPHLVQWQNEYGMPFLLSLFSLGESCYILLFL
ncbi:hypothetical protein RchiOBHm_Chr1g0344951 [Rosa chinensis]|uniref:Cytochrome P450 n=1 Tax=Rosa chinensis TaxID=74649 RepID=A0A2P6SEN7_ROSCH|nr:hypothetical protein RchiOBHm_Chr1g0344951 [Rosa chinensis]